MTAVYGALRAQQQQRPQYESLDLRQEEAAIGQKKPVRLKCGEVVCTWDCGTSGETYMVECLFCEDQPLCTLLEFGEHMQIWHINWDQVNDSDNGGNDDDDDDDESEGTPSDNMRVREISRETRKDGQINEEPAIIVSSTVTIIGETNNEVELPPQPRDYDDDDDDDDVGQRSPQFNEEYEKLVKSVLNGNQTTNGNRLATNAEHSTSVVGAPPNSGMTDEADDGGDDANETEIDFRKPFNDFKLSAIHIAKLIELYKQNEHLWNHKHESYNDPKLRRESWHDITTKWNEICQKDFTPSDLRIRMSTLCQRYIKYRENCVNGIETGNYVKFSHSDSLKFLDEQQSLQRRDDNVEKELSKLIKVYKSFPVLWHSDFKYEKLPGHRKAALNDIRNALKSNGIHLSDAGIQRRLKTIRMRYRSEKIRHLHCKVEGRTFQTEFKYYDQLEYLNEHIPPYLCDCCGRIFEHLKDFKEHKNTINRNTDDSSLIEDDHQFDEIEGIEKDVLSLDAMMSEDAVEQPHEAHPMIVADGIKESFDRLTEDQTHTLIALYSNQPQLWNPNHSDYGSRKLRRDAWRALTDEFNTAYNMHYPWPTLYRKLTDYVKYYKREKLRIETTASCTKWCYYDDFVFMDEVMNDTNELQKMLRVKDQNYKIIQMYREYPQLWNTAHPDYSKRAQRQRCFKEICSRLQDENDIRLSAEKLRNRLIDFRCNYRVQKKQRIAALKCGEHYEPNYDYYEELSFIEEHIAPFGCPTCSMSFQRFTDYNVHVKEHTDADGGTRARRKRRSDNGDGSANTNSENICHICGSKFTLRSNLIFHIKRHNGQRKFPCSMCPKRFFDLNSKRVHECTHSKQYPCVCEQCGRSFVNTSKLNQHIKRHSDQRDFACDQCHKSFFTAFDRDLHVKRHLNIRDKECPHCGKTFVVGSAYYSHLMLHSDVKRYECSQCELKFSQYAGLYKHRKRYHEKK